MPNHRLECFLGKPLKVRNINIYSPTIDEISEVGEVVYNIYISLATFNKEVVLKYLLNIPEEKYQEFENEDSYDLLTSIPSVVYETEKALSFFTRKDVVFNVNTYSYNIDGQILINRDNYCESSQIIQKLNGVIEEEKELKIKFKSESAKKMYEELMKLKKKNTKSDSESLSLKDMLSVLCNAEGNGINIFNVGKLTVYQVYEHFERLGIKEHHKRLLKVWANGYLGENEKLPEWITKSKL